MPSTLFTVTLIFLLQFLIPLFARLFSPKLNSKYLLNEIQKTKDILAKTSAQDNFSVWAKTRRTLDSLIADLEKLKLAHVGATSSFNSTISIIVNILSLFIYTILTLYYSSTPMFYLPVGWFHFDYFLCLPNAPVGSVSISVWFYSLNVLLTRSGIKAMIKS